MFFTAQVKKHLENSQNLAYHQISGYLQTNINVYYLRTKLTLKFDVQSVCTCTQPWSSLKNMLPTFLDLRRELYSGWFERVRNSSNPPFRKFLQFLFVFGNIPWRNSVIYPFWTTAIVFHSQNNVSAFIIRISNVWQFSQPPCKPTKSDRFPLSNLSTSIDSPVVHWLVVVKKLTSVVNIGGIEQFQFSCILGS